MRKPIIAGNWKLNHGISDTISFVKELKANYKNKNSAEVVLAPPFISLESAARERTGSEIKLAAQNAYYKPNGAYTGEVSLEMLKELGIEYVILGHSERRGIFGEINELINLKVLRALEVSVDPILCVGEKLEEREGGITEKIINMQVEKCFMNVKSEDASRVVVAYEPIWAIGTGKNAVPEDAEKVCSLIRETITALYDSTVAEQVRILYGGSVKPANVSGYMALPNVDGALVGGASLKPDSFLEIINY